MINYTVGKKRHEKTPDAFDGALIAMIEGMEIPYWYPTNKIPKGDKTGDPFKVGIINVHHFYTKRNLYCISQLNKTLAQGLTIQPKLVFNSIVATLCSKLVRYNLGHRGNGPLNGTLYVSSLNAESDIFKNYQGKLKDFIKALKNYESNAIMNQNFGDLQNESNSYDYIFIDPPFGSNLMYSELNILWESWLKVITNNSSEAIENKTQGKSLSDYRIIMTDCFKEAYRILKPGRWMTVEFSNTKAAVWNNIQTALTDAGFIIANVSALNKKQGSFNAVTNTTSVKQDLVISAYKPNDGFEDRFVSEAATEEGVWDFVKTQIGRAHV